MGYELARVARRRGAQVTLISGPTALRPLAGVTTVRVDTALEMHAAVMERIGVATVAIMAAAVADFCAAEQRARKAEKNDISVLHLARTPDILAGIGALEKKPFTVGFAAETGSRIDRAERKMVEKGADMIVFNDVLQEGSGFDTDTNVVTIISRGQGGVHQKESLPLMSKEAVASAIFDSILSRKG